MDRTPAAADMRYCFILAAHVVVVGGAVVIIDKGFHSSTSLHHHHRLRECVSCSVSELSHAE